MLKLCDPQDITPIILHQRLTQPDLPLRLAKDRKRNADWAQQPLLIVATDHPGRRTIAAGGDDWAMADRSDLLWRTMHVMMQPGVNGLLATPDVMEEILLLNHWAVHQGADDFLAGKVLIGSMNRGGLTDTVFELDDFGTAYTAQTIQASNLDGGKVLLRMDPSSRDTTRTMRYCFEALTSLAQHQLPAFLEPLPIPHTTDDLVRLVGVASALGPTSARRWLKLPMADDFQRVAGATTCPIVLLGGENPGGLSELLKRSERCFEAGINVRGLMIGRGILYPKDGSDPCKAAAELAGFVQSRRIQEGIAWQNQ